MAFQPNAVSPQKNFSTQRCEQRADGTHQRPTRKQSGRRSRTDARAYRATAPRPGVSGCVSTWLSSVFHSLINPNFPRFFCGEVRSPFSSLSLSPSLKDYSSQRKERRQNEQHPHCETVAVGHPDCCSAAWAGVRAPAGTDGKIII